MHTVVIPELDLTDLNAKMKKNWKKIFTISDYLLGISTPPPYFGSGATYQKSPRWPQNWDILALDWGAVATGLSTWSEHFSKWPLPKEVSLVTCLTNISGHVTWPRSCDHCCCSARSPLHSPTCSPPPPPSNPTLSPPPLTQPSPLLVWDTNS